MDKLKSQSLKEAAWRSRLLRHSQSGKSIAAFCRDEAVSTASFHIWRAKLAAADGHPASSPLKTAFIDLGAIKDVVGAKSMVHGPVSWWTGDGLCLLCKRLERGPSSGRKPARAR
jgi:hypothetical protein